ncbi:hypothetical protein GCM10009827_003930 [Dactylosporangium maewongense]|uniref:Uncharacterized protein n=1 Tax=Dactylosporangium maewongense TaxID=634393 RepID=A0ABN1ZJ92_9ACTN
MDEVQPSDIRVGVLLGGSGARDDLVPGFDPDDPEGSGYAEAWGTRGRHAAPREHRIAAIGQDILRAAAEAVGREVALVVGGVVTGLEQRDQLRTGSFAVSDLQLKFGVKATLGAGKAVEAFLTASNEATVEVTLTLRQPGGTAGTP